MSQRKFYEWVERHARMTADDTCSGQPLNVIRSRLRSRSISVSATIEIDISSIMILNLK